MKEKNLSLARKILLALLAVLVAVGAFFGVISMNRNGVGNTVEGALSASAAEEHTFTDAQKVVADKVTAEHGNLLTELGDEKDHPRTKFLLDEELEKLYGEIEKADDQALKNLTDSYQQRLKVALQKGLAIEDLVSAYNAITGKTITFNTTGDIFTVVNDATNPDPLLTEMQTAITAIKDATRIQGEHIVTVNDTLRQAVLDILEKGVVWSDDDSAVVKAYMAKVTEKVNGATATDEDTHINVLTPVSHTRLDDSKDSTEKFGTVSAKLAAQREKERNDAINQYKAIVHLVFGTALNSVQVPEDLTTAANCKAVNAQLKAALDAKLTPTGAPTANENTKIESVEADGKVTYTVTDESTTLAEHKANLMMLLGAAIDNANEAETRKVDDKLYSEIALVFEQNRLDKSKTAAHTAYEGETGYYKTLTSKGITDEEKLSLNDIEIAERGSVNTALAAVNTALKNAILGLLTGLYDETTDSADTLKYINDIKALVNAAAEKPNDFTGLSDYENLQAADAETQKPEIKLSGVVAALEKMRDDELTAAVEAYKAYYKALTGNPYPENDADLAAELKVDNIKNHLDAVTEGEQVKQPALDGILAINKSLADTTKALINSLLSKDEAGKNLDSKDFADKISTYTGIVSDKLAEANDPEAMTALVNALGAVTNDALGAGTILSLQDELAKLRAAELNNAKKTVVDAYNALFGTNYNYTAETAETFTVEAKDSALTTELDKIDGTTLSELNDKVKEAIKSFVEPAQGEYTEDETIQGDAAAVTAAIDVAFGRTTPAEATYPTAFAFNDDEVNALTTLHTAVVLQKTKDEALKTLQALNTKLSEAPYSSYLTEDTTGDTVEQGTKTKLKNAYDAAVTAINGAEDTDAVGSDLNDGIANMLTAAAEAIAAVEFSDSYKAIYGKASTGHDAALADFQAAIKGKTPTEINTYLKEQLAGKDGVQGLIALAVDPAGEYAATLIGQLQTAVNDLSKEDDKVVNAQIYDYSSVLVDAKEKLEVANKKDLALAAIEAHFKELEESFKTRISTEDDWTKFSGEDLANAKKWITEKITEKGENQSWADYVTSASNQITANQGSAEKELDIAAWTYVAKYELNASLSALSLSLDNSTGELEEALEQLKTQNVSGFTAEAVNSALLTQVKAAIVKALAAQSAATRKLVTDAELSSEVADGDVILAVSKDEKLTELSNSITAQLGKERAAAVKVYKAYYKAIIGNEYAEEDYSNDLGSLSGAVSCEQINNILAKGIDDLFGQILTGKYATSSAAVKDLITTARGNVKTEVDKANVAGNRQVLGVADATAAEITPAVEAKTASLLKDISDALDGDKTTAKNTLKKFYDALKDGLEDEAALQDVLETYVKEGEEKELDNATDCTALNTALKNAMNALLDAYTSSDTANAKIVEIVAGIKDNIETYIKGLNEATDITLANESKVEAFGKEANARIRIERERADAITKLTEAHDTAIGKPAFTGGISEIETKAKADVETILTNASATVNTAAAALDPPKQAADPEVSAIDEAATDWVSLYNTAHGTIEKALKDNLHPDEKDVDVFEQACRVFVAVNVYVKSNRTISNDQNKAFTETDIDRFVNQFANTDKTNYADINKTLIDMVKADIANLKNTDGDTKRVAEAIEAATKVSGTLDALGVSDKIADITETVDTIMNGEKSEDGVGTDGINTIRAEEKDAVKQAYVDAYNALFGTTDTTYTVDSANLADALAAIEAAKDCKEANDTLKTLLGTLLTESVLNDKDAAEVGTYIDAVVEAVSDLIDRVNVAGTRRAPVFKAATDSTTTIDNLEIEGHTDNKTFGAVKTAVDTLRLNERKAALEEYVAAYNATVAEADQIQLKTDGSAFDLMTAAEGKTVPALATDAFTAIHGTTYAADANDKLLEAVDALIHSLSTDNDSPQVKAAVEAAVQKTAAEGEELTGIYGVTPGANGISDIDSIVTGLVTTISGYRTAENTAAVNAYAAAYSAIFGKTVTITLGTDEQGATTITIDGATDEEKSAITTDVNTIIAAATTAAKNTALKNAVVKLLPSLVVEHNAYDSEKDAPEIVAYMTADTEGNAEYLILNADSDKSTGISNLANIITNTIAAKVKEFRNAEADAAVEQYEEVYKLLNGEDSTPVESVKSTIRGKVYAVDMNAALKTAVKELIEKYVKAAKDSKAVQELVTEHSGYVDGAAHGNNGISTFITVAEDGTKSGIVVTAKKEIDDTRAQELIDAKNAYLAVVKAFTGEEYKLNTKGELPADTDTAKIPQYVKTAIGAIGGAANTKAAIDALKAQIALFLVGSENVAAYFADKDSATVTAYLSKLNTALAAAIKNGETDREVPVFADEFALTLVLGEGETAKTIATFGAAVKEFKDLVAADNATVQTKFAAALKALTGLEVTGLTAELQKKYGEIATESKTLVEANEAAADLMKEVIKTYVQHTVTTGEGQDAKVEVLDSKAYSDIVAAFMATIDSKLTAANGGEDGEDPITVLDLTTEATKANEDLTEEWEAEKATAKATYLYVYNVMNGLSEDKAVTASAEAVKTAITAIEAAKNASELNNVVFEQVKALLNELAKPESQNTKDYFDLVIGTPAVAATDKTEATPATGLTALYEAANNDAATRVAINWNGETKFTVGEDEDQTFADVYAQLVADRLAARKAATEEFVEAYNATLKEAIEFHADLDEEGNLTLEVVSDDEEEIPLPEAVSAFLTAINAVTTANEANAVLKAQVKALIGTFVVEGDSDAVQAKAAEYTKEGGKIDKVEAEDNGVSDFTLYTEDETTGEKKVSGNLVATAKTEIEGVRTAQLAGVITAYLNAYNAITGKEVTATDELVKDACDELGESATFEAALKALNEKIDALLEAAKIEGDSVIVTDYIDDAIEAVDAAFAGSELVVPELTDALKAEGKVLNVALTEQRKAEKTAAVDEYKAAHKLFTGKDCAATDVVVEKINDAANTTAANAELVKGVKALLTAYVDTADSKAVNDLVTTHTATIEAAEPQTNGICEFINVAEDGTAAGILATAKKDIDDERAAERTAAVAQYTAAYKTVTGEDYTAKDGDVVSKINATTNATDANKLLVAAVLELLQANDLSEGDSKTVRDYLVANGAAEKLFNEAAGDNGISVLTAEKGESPLATAQEDIVALRAADVRAAMDRFNEAYVLLLGSEDTDALFNDAAANHADTEILDAKFALEVLKDVFGTVIANTVTHKGDSTGVKAYLASVKEAVEDYLDHVIASVKDYAIPVFTGENAAVLTVDDEDVTLTEIKDTLDAMRAAECAEAQEIYKAYYKVVKGADYDEETASADEKKVLTDLGKAGDNAALNNLLKSAVDALIDAYTDGDSTTVGAVATAQKAALDKQFDAAAEEGVLADQLGADIARALDEINFRRHQDQMIAEINAAYDELALDRMEAGAKTELETLKNEALDAIEKAELGEKTLVAGNADLDDMLTDALDSLNRKEAEGIAKQEYLDSYKALTGKTAATTDATVKAALDAIAEAAKAEKEYVSVVNAALRDAVNAVLESLLLRDDRNVLIDSQDVKAVVEEAKKNVETLTRSTEEVPEVSDTLTGIKAKVEALREEEKANASEAVDSVVDSITDGKTYPADVQEKIDELVEAAKDQIAGADYAGIVLIQNKLEAQIKLLDAIHAYEEKGKTDGVATESVKAIIDAAIDEIGAASSASAVEKAAKAALLNADKAYAKLYLSKLVSAESDTVKAILTGSDGFNAKVEGATSAEQIEAVIAEAKIAIESVKFVDTYSILRKAFGAVNADDKAALEAALAAFDGLKNTEVKDYLNKTSDYTSIPMQIADMLNKAAFEAKKSETIDAAKALAEGKDGKVIADMLERQLHSINDIWYEAHYNDDDRDAYLKQQQDALAAELTATDDVVKHAEKVQSTADKMEEALGEYLTSGVYSGETARNLRNIIDKYLEQAENVSTSGSVEENLQEIYNQAIAELKAAPTWAVTAGEIDASGKTDDYAEDYEGTTLWGYVTNDSGIEGGVSLSIETKDSTVTMETIQNGTLKAAAGSNLTEEEMKAIVEDKDVIATFDISLLKQNVKVETFNGLYKVTVLLPEALRDTNGIEVVYVGANNEVEVFNAEVSEDGKYLTFTTEHFSEFVILGEATVNLWWLVITLTVVLGLELVALLVVLLKKGGKKDEKVASVLPLGLLLAVLPMNATGICVILGVGVVALGVGIFFAARHKKSQK